jgi:hypothetical protein
LRRYGVTMVPRAEVKGSPAMLISIPRGGRQEPALMKVVLLYRRITASRKKAPDDAGAFRLSFGLHQ